MKKEVIIITAAGIVIGLAEALIYYNMGRNKGGKFSYKLPPKKELTQTLGIVVATSIATAMLTDTIERVLKFKKLSTT